MDKWFVFKPIAYLGMLLALTGITAPRLFNIENSYTELLCALLFLIGIYLILKGRKAV